MTHQEIQIRTGARLHFGLLDVAPPFGGIGMMTQDPETVIRICPRETFRADQAISQRAEPIARRFCEVAQLTWPLNVSVRVESQPNAHSGFGSGTQISLAIAEGLDALFETNLSRQQLIGQVAQRGKRSAVGVHGYFGGGFLFEQSEKNHCGLGVLRNRLPFPPTWHAVLVLPRDHQVSVAGDVELEHFRNLGPAPSKQVKELQNMIEQQILPAVKSIDFAGFTDALSRYNHASGMLFSSVQGGPYNGNAVSQTVETLTQAGLSGVGQSSWGPCVFGWIEDAAEADQLGNRLRDDGFQVQITTARNTGREIVSCP